MQNNVIEQDKLILEGRKNFSMTGVQAVDGFSEQCLKLTVSGNKVIVTGENIKITAFNKCISILTNKEKIINKYLPFFRKLIVI